jgi:hypothetical protein
MPALPRRFACRRTGCARAAQRRGGSLDFAERTRETRPGARHRNGIDGRAGAAALTHGGIEMFIQKTFRASASLLVLALVAAGCQSMGLGRGEARTPKSGTATARMGPVSTAMFQGAKANTGHAVFTKRDGRIVLTLSDDFKVPDTPAPHWQVVDTKGNVHLLQRLVIKDDKYNKTITVPSYVRDVAKVQIWCAWAETLLGEASFPAPVK